MKTVLLIDGGYLRASAKEINRAYDATLIAQFAQGCIIQGEYLLRVLYYDAPPYDGFATKPVSGATKRFRPNDTLLEDVAKLERFAVRRGKLGFRGWKPRHIPIAGGAALTDADFKPIFEQKGVDMRVGLDIAAYAERRSVDRIILLSGDTDMTAAMKLGRRSGLEIGLITLPHPARPPHDELLSHSDFIRPVVWP